MMSLMFKMLLVAPEQQCKMYRSGAVVPGVLEVTLSHLLYTFFVPFLFFLLLNCHFVFWDLTDKVIIPYLHE